MSTAPKYSEFPHIEHDEGGVPLIASTTMKVVELVMAQRAHGWSPEELSFQYPHLSMGQVHSALAYYWDHREELDRDIERRTQTVEALRANAPARLVERLAATKHQ